MKTLIEILGTVFLIVGAVIGAGFISGSELVSFFGADNFTFCVVLSGILFFICFYIVLISGSKSGSLYELNNVVLKNGFLFDVAVRISCFLSVSVMLSAIDAVTVGINMFDGIPIYSLLSLFFVAFISRYGVKGARIANFVTVPIILFAVNFIVVMNGRVDISFGGGIEIKGIGKAFLYVTMNLFINLPSLADGSRGKSAAKIFTISLLSAVALAAESLLILGTVKGYGSDLSAYPMPFFTALGDGDYAIPFAVVCLVGIFTSLVAAYYPLREYAVGKLRGTGEILLASACFFTSRLGIKNIIDYTYPVIGGFGAVYLIYCIRYLIKNYGKRNKRTTEYFKRNRRKTKKEGNA